MTPNFSSCLSNNTAWDTRSWNHEPWKLPWPKRSFNSKFYPGYKSSLPTCLYQAFHDRGLTCVGKAIGFGVWQWTSKCNTYSLGNCRLTTYPLWASEVLPVKGHHLFYHTGFLCLVALTTHSLKADHSFVGWRNLQEIHCQIKKKSSSYLKFWMHWSRYCTLHRVKKKRDVLIPLPNSPEDWTMITTSAFFP